MKNEFEIMRLLWDGVRLAMKHADIDEFGRTRHNVDLIADEIDKYINQIKKEI